MKQDNLKQKSLIAIFVDDHRRIVAMFNDFKDNKFRRSPKIAQILGELMKALDRHMHLEESLYGKYREATGTMLPIIQTVRREHGLLRKRLAEMHKALAQGKDIDVSGFGMLLRRHSNIEERLLYSELEPVISAREMDEVYARIRRW
ncbi:MAG: hemerythrin domain-containing protein [archaeon]